MRTSTCAPPVEYTDNRGSGKTAEAITKRPVPSLNRRPTFPDTETGERTVDENIRAGANIGAPVAAVDPENNRLTYTLTAMTPMPSPSLRGPARSG